MQSLSPCVVMAYLDVMQPTLQRPRVIPLPEQVVIGRARHQARHAELRREGDPAAQLCAAAAHDEGTRLPPTPAAPTASQSSPAGQEPFLGLAEHTVSRRHARIERRGNRFFLEDLHSVNGTYVGAERLAPGAARVLCDGDEVRICSTCMTFHCLSAPAGESGQPIITGAVDATEYSRAWRGDVHAAQAAQPAAGNASAADLQATIQKLHAMSQVSIALGVVTDRATLIEKIMRFIFELFPLAERAFIVFLKPEGSRGGVRDERAQQGQAPAAAPAPNGGTAAHEPPLPLHPDAARRRDGAVLDPRAVRLSRTILREVLGNKQAILSVDMLADRHFASQESIVAQPIRSVMCVPLLLESECLGLIQVDTASDPHAFKAPDLEMLTGVCAEAAVTLKTFQLYSDIERLLDGFVRASVQAIEERDPATAGHSFRVADFAERLARAVDRADAPALRAVRFSVDQLREIRYAALLHDFGRVGVREHVLRKEKKLHASQMQLLEQRFCTARACLEREAYRQLVLRHARQPLGRAEFRREKLRVEQALRIESQRLGEFMQAIQCSNEPAVSEQAGTQAATALQLAQLQQAQDYRYPAADGPATLLEPFEFSALRLTRGCLTADERRQIEMHVADSHAFLILIPWTGDLAKVPAIAHGHHEKLDGSGYPRGLRGPEISVQTRILTICDIFDALTAADRPYKKALGIDQALALMQAECHAGHLDAGLFDVFAHARAWSNA